MALIAFAGPSVGSPDPAAARRIDFRPPARCGDITRAVRERPAAIGLIDGVFETAASVWHKEILYALEQGVVVFGAASIGALRAAELEPFGMIGIGEIFAAYRDGRLEDDDEVAVLHGPGEVGYLPLTEAMINVRAAVAGAEQAGVLTPDAAWVFCRVAKELFYKRRTWVRIAAGAVAGGVAADVVRRFERWRVRSGVDVKRRDAALLIDAMLGPGAVPAAGGARPVLSRTKYWLGHLEVFDAGRVQPQA